MQKRADTGQFSKQIDTVQERLAGYACQFEYESISPEALHAAKVRVLDTLGVLIGGFFGEPSQICRMIAASAAQSDGATVIGTRQKTTVDLAAFVNCTTARFTEFNDLYHWPGSRHGHPSDVITPVLAVAEHVHASGREFLAAVVLAYEMYSRLADAIHEPFFDCTNFCCLGSAVGGGKLLRLSHAQLAHCISMAMVPNNALTQVRGDFKSMFKIAASGQAGRAGVFAAVLAKAGMEGPHLPFEGKAGWCTHIAGEQISFDTLGGGLTQFRIVDSRTRHRPAMGETHAAIFAAEKIAPKIDVRQVCTVKVETYERACELVGSRQHPWCWDPPNRECADQSIPYVVAAALMDGTVTLRTFDDAHLTDPLLRALMEKIDIVENPEYTQAFNNLEIRPDPSLAAYERLPREHHARVTVTLASGEQLSAHAGGDADDLSVQKDDRGIEQKFRSLTEDYLGSKQVTTVIERLWNIAELADVGNIPRWLLVV